MSMWSSKKYLTIAVIGVGLGVAAASPASAQLFGMGGTPGAGFGMPVTYVIVPVYPASPGYGASYGYGGYPSYGASYGYGGYPSYGAAYGYGGYPSYGAAYGDGAAYGAAIPAPAYGWGCRSRHHRAGYGGYSVAYLPRHNHANYAVASLRPHHGHALYASLYGMKHHVIASLKRNVRFG
jgi:hypothetical protein